MKTSPKEVLIVILDEVRSGKPRVRRRRSSATRSSSTRPASAGLDARAALDALDQQRKVLLERRHTADQASLYLVKGVVNAIKGDPTQGEDGEPTERSGTSARACV